MLVVNQLKSQENKHDKILILDKTGTWRQRNYLPYFL
jgi:hypothetical protein